MKCKPGNLFWTCLNCGRYRGYHKQETIQCPSEIKGQWLDTTFKRRPLKKRKRQTRATNKRSTARKESANFLQQLKTEIAAIIKWCDVPEHADEVMKYAYIINKLRQLSAV